MKRSEVVKLISMAEALLAVVVSATINCTKKKQSVRPDKLTHV